MQQEPNMTFDMKTAAALLAGTKVSADKLSQFVSQARQASDDCARRDQTIFSLQQTILQKDAEISTWKMALLAQEAQTAEQGSAPPDSLKRKHSMENGKDYRRTKLYRAAIHCGHTMSYEELTLRAKAGSEENALHQLADRLVEACDTLITERAPKFDAVSPQQEQLARQFCSEIAEKKEAGSATLDPVRLLEMAQALYLAECPPLTTAVPADLQANLAFAPT
jgi:septal ring factor EnvC (AmiA/AmiB activator)